MCIEQIGLIFVIISALGVVTQAVFADLYTKRMFS
jgi:hypothetical protein